MEIIVLFAIDLLFLILSFLFDFKNIPKINVDIFVVVPFFLLYFLLVYKRYYLSSRRKLIIFSGLLGIFLGELQITNIIVIKKGTVEHLGILMGIILLIIIVLEVTDFLKDSFKTKQEVVEKGNLTKNNIKGKKKKRK